MKRIGTALWKKDGLTGSGKLNTKSGALKDIPYSFKTRFENPDGLIGTNPEELLAAAHAGCFTMALSFILGEHGHTPDELFTEVTVQLDNVNGNFEVTSILMNLTAQIEGVSKSEFDDLANVAKENCPISKLISADKVKLSAKLF
ncbi:OsmC family protein [Flagellimonas sp. S174]|uniref:OsmC family protein n=1 Tax=Flagellimonas sp. S174 TaxID=3410790 RepID=UPI003BF5F0F2